MATAETLDGAADAWVSGPWVAHARAWLADLPVVRAHGGDVRIAPERARPWGAVWKVGTGPDLLWFKAEDPAGFEGRLTSWLSGVGVGDPAVPRVVASCPERGWWVMQHAGSPLRPARGEEAAAWGGALERYAAVQRAVEQRTDELVAMGVPHLPPRALPERLDELLRDPRLLVDDPRGLSRAELRDVAALLPRYSRWCEELASFGIPDTLQHDDLSGGNVCRRADGRVVVIDWADAHVGHPFGSLLFPLRELDELGASPEAVERVVDAYCGAWARDVDADALRRAQVLALRVACVSKALSWSRALGACERTALNDYYASPEARWLRRLLHAARG